MKHWPVSKLLHSSLSKHTDCVINELSSYDLKKMPEMLAYYADKGCEVRTLAEYQRR